MAAESDAEAARNGIISIVVFWGLTLYGFQNFLPSSKRTTRSLSSKIVFAQTVYCWGFQCFFLSVSALTGLLCPPSWACLSACLRSCFSACLPSSVPAQLRCCVCLPGCVSRLVVHVVSHGLGCGVRLLGLVSQVSISATVLCLRWCIFFGHILNFTFTNKSNNRVGFRGRTVFFFSDLAIILTFLVEKWK